MTAPVTTEALVEAPYVLLKRGLFECPGHCGYTGVLRRAGRFSHEEATAWAKHGDLTMMLASEAPDYSPACWHEVQVADLLDLLRIEREAKEAALAALQQVTAERDEEKSRADRIDAKLGELNAAVRECLPPVEVLVAEREAAEASLATANAEIARLRAEGEAKDRALKVKAEEQVAYWRERQRAEKCLEDGVSEDGSSYTPIGDEAAWQGGYCNGRMSEADWWAKTFQYWPNEAARAATAETAKAAAEAAWPTGCIKPNACSRHRTCVYAMSAEKCRHFGQDLGPAIEAAEAARAATAREG